MTRLGRWFAPGIPQHIIQRGNNRQAVFFSDEDQRAYRDWLQEAAEEHGLAIHAYVLMTNHVHLFATPRDVDSIPKTMQKLGRLYVRAVNRAYGRSGTLWEGRYRATVVETDRYALAVMRYIELNPVRANMTGHPRGHRWSSYHANALGHDDPLLTPCEPYQSLGLNVASRREAYRDLFTGAFPEDTLATIRTATNSGWALGGEAFARAMEGKSDRRATPKPRGGLRIGQ